MINDRILQVPFAFYRQEVYQERFMEGCDQNCPPYLFAPNDRLLPFQIKIPKNGAPLMITGLSLTVNCTTNAMDLAVNISDLAIYNGDPEYHFIIYKGDTQMEFTMPNGSIVPLQIPYGIYNVKLSTNKGVFFSELFCPKTQLELDKMFKLEWWAQKDFAGAIYSTGYKNRCYVNAVMMPPKIELEQEEEKNGYGVPIPTLQRFLHKHRITVPDILHSLAIAICTIPMHTDRKLTLPDGRDANMELAKPEPEFFDCGAIVALEFVESVLIKTACSD